jgi:hypothetical protein
LAIIRHPDAAAASYLAMVEENEIRAGLSFYERGRIVARAVDEGAYASDKDALAALFHAAPRAKRSKIGSFVRIVRALDDVLQFPTALSERSGLALAQALGADAGFAARLRKKLDGAHPQTAGAEQAVVAVTIKGPKTKEPSKLLAKPTAVLLPSGLEYVTHADGKIMLQGAVLGDANFTERLIQTLKSLK